jgi:SAM-dependent methyltransferase
MDEAWASGDAYEPYIGRWSRLVADEFLDWLAPPDGARWLDVGCGTGAVTSAVLRRCDPAEVVGVDPSAAHVSWCMAHVDDRRARFGPGDATHLPEGPFDVVVSGLVLNFVPDPDAALAAMAAAAPGGTVAAYVWDYEGRMEMLRHFWEAAGALDPSAGERFEGTRFRGWHADAMEERWRRAALRDVRVGAVEVPTVFADFDDYWRPFLGGQGPAPAYVASLPEDRRTALRERLRAELPAAPDGTIALVARAWAVRGTAGP